MANFARGLALDPPELDLRRIVDELVGQVPVTEALMRDEGVTAGSRVVDVGRHVASLLDDHGATTLDP
jgi:hypothetical protein